jgi:hypothetical protein
MGSYLRPVTAIFVLRNTSLWNTPSNLLWLRNTAKQLLAYIDAAEGSCVNVEMMVRLSIDSKGNDSHRNDDVNVFNAYLPQKLRGQWYAIFANDKRSCMRLCLSMDRSTMPLVTLKTLC